MKKCSKCGVQKAFKEFSKDKASKDKFSYWCKTCVRQYQIDNKSNIDKYNAKYQKQYRAQHKDEASKYNRQYVLKYKSEIAEYNKQYKIDNKNEIAEYKIHNREEILKTKKQYRVKHKNEIAEYDNQYRKNRRIVDINYKLKTNLRTRLNRAIKNNYKTGSAVSDLGCTIEAFNIYIEKQFTPGMSCGNYGVYGWHIDHIKPLALFDLTDREQFLKACHYTNMQPLWAWHNLEKGATIINKENSMKYLSSEPFTIANSSKAYRDNYDRVFGKKKKDEEVTNGINKPKEIPPAPPELEKPKKKNPKKKKIK